MGDCHRTKLAEPTNVQYAIGLARQALDKQLGDEADGE